MTCFVLNLRVRAWGQDRGRAWEEKGRQAHLQGTQIQLCMGLQTRSHGLSAYSLGSSSQGDRAHSLPVMLPLALSERCPVGRERHPDHLDTSGLGDMGGLRRKRDLEHKHQAKKGCYTGFSPPKPSAFGLETASHLGMGSGTQQGRGGTLLNSGPLLLPGKCAPGRPAGLLCGTPSLQGSSGQQATRWLGPLESKGCAPFPSSSSCPKGLPVPLSGPAHCRLQHRCLTSFAPGGQVHSPPASWPWGQLQQCKVGTGWALHCPLAIKA